MNKVLFIIAIAFLAIVGCKPTEENYRAAYEKAKERQSETGDSLTTAQLRKSQEPRLMAVGPDTLPVMTFYVAREADFGNKDLIRKYCVVVGRFKQVFNARSMAERLVSGGFKNAFVVHDAQGYYYVACSSTDVPDETGRLLEKVKNDDSVVLRSPYPYILRPGHLVR